MQLPVLQSRRDSHGSALVVGLVIATILGLTLASYLVLVQGQHRSMIRSQTWAASLALSEAGVEEALAFINKFAASPFELSTWTNNPGSEGWTQSGNVFSKSTTVDATVGSYTVYVTNLLDASNLPNIPAIFSVGSAVWDPPGGFVPRPVYAAVGVPSGSANEPVVRRVYVQTRKTPLFGVPMAAIGQINLKGNNIATDSFNSADPAHSINGQYPTADLSKTLDNGTVVTLSTLINSLNVGNADIKGMVKTGPNGTAAIGPSGSVGSKAWVDGGNKGIQPGYFADDMNIDFPDAAEPSVIWSALPAATKTTINGVTYDRVFYSDGNYSVGTLSGKILIATNAHVILKVTNKVALSSGEGIDVAANDASLAIYMEGSSFTVGGTASINNLSKNALNFQLYGMTNMTSLTFGANAAFSGTIYAPQADFSLGGGGSTVYDFVGASVSKTVTMNGHFKFHYDENLALTGPSRGYVPTSWAEK